ncbi:putative cysteine protease ATG4B [Blattamonas nauphoetae]|uniref:Cysteine protease n=1 Tax=Blattamonas nauphoetae TaxID=2049346 RepID=A0ABQ9Y0L2_9EUKA|nr:putative cysteine protease ATG4B [Blattamonas nauphoetae]
MIKVSNNTSRAKYRVEAPISMLGTVYTDPEQFSSSVNSLVYLTFRNHFNPTSQSFTSDSGFGCMIRSGSMLVATALQSIYFGESFRLDAAYVSSCTRLKWLTSLFSEEMQKNTRHLHPFSIQHLMELGAQYGKRQGTWFAPGTIAKVYQDLLMSYLPMNQAVSVYICEQGLNTIHIPDVISLFSRREAPKKLPTTDKYVPPLPQCYNPTCMCHTFNGDHETSHDAPKPVLILVPTRLGMNRIQEEHLPFLERLFGVPNFCGIAGGHPKSGHFFFAAQNGRLFYLDPHTTRASVDVTMDDVEATFLDEKRANDGEQGAAEEDARDDLSQNSQISQTRSESADMSSSTVFSMSNADPVSAANILSFRPQSVMSQAGCTSGTVKLSNVHSVKLTNVDPSMCLGFLVRNEQELRKLKNDLDDLNGQLANHPSVLKNPYGMACFLHFDERTRDEHSFTGSYDDDDDLVSIGSEGDNQSAQEMTRFP